MISAISSGSFAKTTSFLKFMQTNRIFNILDLYGKVGVSLLSSATPIDTGETASSWKYTVTHSPGRHALNFYNTSVENGVNVAILIQYGHGTGTGGYVEGIDYINPVIRPLFQQILDDIWRQVTNG